MAYELTGIEVQKDLTSGSKQTKVFYIDEETEGVRCVSFYDTHPHYNTMKTIVDNLIDTYHRSLRDNSHDYNVDIDMYIDDLDYYCHLINQVEEELSQVAQEIPDFDGRLTVSGSHVFMDLDPIDPVLEKYILRLLENKDHIRKTEMWGSFVKFVMKLYANPDPHIREQLYGWLDYMNRTTQGFSLTFDGNIIGYKGCGGTLDNPQSVKTGTAFVDGVKHNGSIPNPLGSIITMPRSSVENDPSVGCSYGLHVGTYDYASSWSRGVLLVVEVDPRDIVSIPTECEAQKMRVCRYKVLDICEGPDNTLIHDLDDYNDEEDFCECGDSSISECECF